MPYSAWPGGSSSRSPTASGLSCKYNHLSLGKRGRGRNLNSAISQESCESANAKSTGTFLPAPPQQISTIGGAALLAKSPVVQLDVMTGFKTCHHPSLQPDAHSHAYRVDLG